MITDESIQKVKDQALVEEVVGDFVTLKKSGASFKGLSPFSNEKSPSFIVSPSKQIWKCFSTGVGGGDSISFLIKYGKTFLEAIEYLATKYNIALEYVDRPEETEEQISTRKKNAKILEYALSTYIKALGYREGQEPSDCYKYLNATRGYSEETIISWQLGFAPDQRKLLTEPLIENGYYEQAEQLGIIRSKNGSNYDFFRGRVMFPIHNHKGQLVGFGGRALETDKGIPKYLNSPESETYNKSGILYGLDKAIQSIRDEGRVFLTEGYTDVISMHQEGASNTIATCGTSLTEQHVRLLLRFTDHVVLLRDGDSAGRKAAFRDLELLIRHGAQVEICELEENEDPDSFCKALQHEAPSDRLEELQRKIENRIKDGVLLYCEEILNGASSPFKRQHAVQRIAEFICGIKGEILIDQYISQIVKIETWLSKPVLRKLVSDIQKSREEKGDLEEKKSFLNSLPETDRSSVLEHGFYSKSAGNATGYYFRYGSEGSGSFQAVSNFVITPLFHKRDPEDNTRIIRINNGVTPAEVIELPSKAMISVDSFKSYLFDQGPYFFDGSKSHLDKLNKFYLWNFPTAFSLRNLGWQPEGFWAWYNRSFNGKLSEYNEAGLVKHGDQLFFSPASSDIYKNFRKDDDQDPYENDKYLAFVKSPISFYQWSDLMNKAYPDHAIPGVLWAMVCLFKDIVFKVDNNAPFLYSYGPSQSGKSKFHESISNLFFKEMPAFNLNSGTDFAFFQRLSRFKNCPVQFNEFNDDVVKDIWFEAIKGGYDGEGRERGKGMSKHLTETQKINGLIMLAGQYLSTRDDNSVLSRSILRSFKKQTNRPDEQTAAYEKLKAFEKQGITSIIIELLEHRELIKEEYSKQFNSSMKELALSIRKEGELFNERVLRNYTSLLTMFRLFSGKVSLPWQEKEIFSWIKNEVLEISSMISSTDILVDFWNSIETLFEKAEIKSGIHFKIETESKVRVHIKGKDKDYKEFQEPRKMLYVRLPNVQQIYAQWKRSTGGKAMDLQSLKSYLKDRDYYVGYVDNTRFHRYGKDQNGVLKRKAYSTSALIFDYKQLKINLEHHDDEVTDNSPEGRAERETDLAKKAQELQFDHKG